METLIQAIEQLLDHGEETTLVPYSRDVGTGGLLGRVFVVPYDDIETLRGIVDEYRHGPVKGF